MSRDKRQKRDLHALNDDGLVLCNPRDEFSAAGRKLEQESGESSKESKKPLFALLRSTLDFLLSGSSRNWDAIRLTT
jgi:hypothetical protein